jgi:hypothetical protein
VKKKMRNRSKAATKSPKPGHLKVIWFDVSASSESQLTDQAPELDWFSRRLQESILRLQKELTASQSIEWISLDDSDQLRKVCIENESLQEPCSMMVCIPCFDRSTYLGIVNEIVSVFHDDSLWVEAILVLGQWWAGHARTEPIPKQLIDKPSAQGLTQIYWFQLLDRLLPKIVSHFDQQEEPKIISKPMRSGAISFLIISDDREVKELWLEALATVNQSGVAGDPGCEPPQGGFRVVVIDDRHGSLHLKSEQSSPNGEFALALYRKRFSHAQIVLLSDFPNVALIDSSGGNPKDSGQPESNAVDWIVGKPYSIFDLIHVLVRFADPI